MNAEKNIKKNEEKKEGVDEQSRNKQNVDISSIQKSSQKHLGVPEAKPVKMRTFFSKNLHVTIEGEITEEKERLYRRFTEKLKQNESNSSSNPNSAESKEKWKKAVKQIGKQRRLCSVLNMFLDEKDSIHFTPDMIGFLSITDENALEMLKMNSNDLISPEKNTYISSTPFKQD